MGSHPRPEVSHVLGLTSSLQGEAAALESRWLSPFWVTQLQHC